MQNLPGLEDLTSIWAMRDIFKQNSTIFREIKRKIQSYFILYLENIKIIKWSMLIEMIRNWMLAYHLEPFAIRCSICDIRGRIDHRTTFCPRFQLDGI